MSAVNEANEVAELAEPVMPVRQDERPKRRAVIWQPRQPIFWLFVVLLVVGVPYTVFELVMLRSNPQAALAALLLMAVQATLLALIARALPKLKKRQPVSLRLAALAWGAAVVPTIAMFANTSASGTLDQLGLTSFGASLSAPINEDLMRVLGVLVVLTLAVASGRRITVMDGAVYGFIVGAGFEVVENLLYALRGADFGETLSVGVTRLLVGFGLHALWTTVSGAALAYCLLRRQGGLGARWWVLVLGIALPSLLHALWDAPDFSIFSILKFALLIVGYGLTVLIFLLAVRWGRRSDVALFGGELAAASDLAPTEVTADVTSAVEAEGANGAEGAIDTEHEIGVRGESEAEGDPQESGRRLD